MTAHIFCWGCAEHGVVNKVTAGLRCSCGSNDLDLYEASPAQLARVAAVHTPNPGAFTSFMVSASQSVGDEIKGWDVYKGPMPGPNSMNNGVGQPVRCSVCRGSGYDIQDKAICRECGGSGQITPTTTAEPPAVAKHNYPSTQTSVPFMGRRKQSDIETKTAPDWWSPKEYNHQPEQAFAMPGAKCPNGNCGASTTNLVHDYKDDAWWHCPSCGPLANVDRNPEINPYSPPEGFKPKPRQFRESKKIFGKQQKTGRLMKVIASVGTQNPGLRRREIVGLARETVRRYPEAQ